MAYAIILAKQTEAALMAMVPRQAAATKAATSKALHLIEREIKDTLSTGSHKRGEPTGSAPGSPPDLVSGALRRSVQVEGPLPTGPTSVEGQVGPTMIYARIQELGGQTGRAGRTTLPARPYVEPSFVKVMPEIGVIYREAWAAALRDIGI